MTTATGSEIEVAASADIPDGQVRTFTAGAARVAVARTGGVLYAIQDLCSHDGGPLGAGSLDEFQIECPRHGARFDVRTGEVTRMPAITPIDTFPVRENNGKVLVTVPAGDADDGDDW